MPKFLVVEISYEYNDEYYSTTDDEAYTLASRLFNTEEEAQAEADRLNETQGFEGSTGEDDEEDGHWIEPFTVVEVEDPL